MPEEGCPASEPSESSARFHSTEPILTAAHTAAARVRTGGCRLLPRHAGSWASSGCLLVGTRLNIASSRICRLTALCACRPLLPMLQSYRCAPQAAHARLALSLTLVGGCPPVGGPRSKSWHKSEAPLQRRRGLGLRRTSTSTGVSGACCPPSMWRPWFRLHCAAPPRWWPPAAAGMCVCVPR